MLAQVLFMIVNLGIPDLLLSGPRTADDLAANIGPHVHPDRLARILDFAAAVGMVNRKKISGNARKDRKAAATPHANGFATAAAAAAADGCRGADAPASDGAMSQLKVGLLEARSSKTVLAVDPSDQDLAAAGMPSSSSSGRGPLYVYSLSATSACLTSESPVCCADMVKMFEDRSQEFACLSEAMRDGKIPFEVFSGGKLFWQHIAENPSAAKTFDLAMAQINNLGGKAVAAKYPFNKFETVIDVAGGVGGFLREIMIRHKKPCGVLFDQQGQIERAEKLWAHDTIYQPHAHRVQLVAGDVFDVSTIPPPPSSSSGKVAYILRNILHDWPDADCLSILQSIRQCVTATDASRVKLLVIEPTSMETPCKNIYPHRLMSDLLMLAAFGDAKERNKQQFEALFGATGWKLTKITPSNGIFLILEAVPV
eukprot:GHUV01009473.1.p1 GENE.GHUV01009473.1~~GHUV01009473.1.p1  ORF type:complete len:426 (+),score=140.32 GHUV01009473.1:983-2260(+)